MPHHSVIYKTGLFGIGLCLVFLSALSATWDGKAQGGTQAAVVPSAVHVDVGSSTSVSVNITNGVDINAFDITLTYDPAVVSLESYAPGSFLSNLVRVYEEKSAGSLRVVYTQLASPGVTGDGTLITLVFHGLESGSSPVTIASLILANKSNEKIYPALQNGVISVGSGIPNTPTSTTTATFTTTSTATQTRTSTRTPTVTQTSAAGGAQATLTATGTAITLTPTVSGETPEATPEGQGQGTETMVTETETAGENTQQALTGPTNTPQSGVENRLMEQLPCGISIVLALILLLLIGLILKNFRKTKPPEGA